MALGPTSARRRQFGQVITPQTFGATGKGITDDTGPWDQFQAASGLKAVPPGLYLVRGTVLRFDTGCIGNGVFNDSSPPTYDWGYWDQPWGARNAESLICHFREMDGNSPPLVSPTIKVQNKVNYSFTSDPENAPDFARGVGAYFETIGEGNFATNYESKTGNFWGLGSTVHNKFAGRMGMAAIIGRAWDAREDEVPNILLYGASKSTGAGFQAHRRSLFSSGAYMIAMEAYVDNRADEPLDVPYVNDDSLAFEDGGTTIGVHVKVRGGNATYKGAPVSGAIVISGAADARHGCYNGIVVGGGAFKINENGDCAPGTVGITLASHRDDRAAEIGIKFRKNKRHLWFREGARIQSSVTRFMNEDGSCVVSIESSGAAGGNAPALSFRDGADASLSPEARTIALAEAFPSNFQLTSKLGEVRLQAEDGAGVYVATAQRFAPAVSQDNARALGGPDRRWSVVYAGTGTINTSDARLKEQVTDLTAAEVRVAKRVRQLLRKYKWKDAVATKGAAARWHFGVLAQDVVGAFTAEGLDAMAYGIVCHDEWADAPEQRLVTRVSVRPPIYQQVLIRPARFETVEVEPGVFEDSQLEAEYADGDVIEPEQFEEVETIIPAVTAGTRFGIRYDELTAFLLAALLPE